MECFYFIDEFKMSVIVFSFSMLLFIKVINYFCEMMLEEELERVRKANIKPEPTKNTVLVLPKLKGKQV